MFRYALGFVAFAVGFGLGCRPETQGSSCDGSYALQDYDKCTDCCKAECKNQTAACVRENQNSGVGNVLLKCKCSPDGKTTGAPPPESEPEPPKSTCVDGKESCCKTKDDCGPDIPGRDGTVEKQCVANEQRPPKGFSCAECKTSGCSKCCRGYKDKRQAQSWGDPHIRTLDGLAYDLQAVGEFVLVTDGAGFEIQVRQGPYGGSKVVSVNTAIAMKIGSDRVGIYATKSPPLRVNGAPTTISNGELALPGGGVIYSDDNLKFDIRWPNGTSLEIQTYSDHVDLDLVLGSERGPEGLRGLLGNADGVPINDLQDRSGTAIMQPPMFRDLYNVFAASWRISQAESLFDYEPGEDTTTFTDLSFPTAPVTTSTLSQADRESATTTCTAKGITDKTALDACILDVALTGDPGYANGATSAAPPVLAIQGMYFYDFEGTVGGEWSSTKTGTANGSATRQKSKFLGEFGNDGITLTLDGLATHTSVSIGLELYILRSWDGNTTNFGPDVWDLSVDGGPTLLHTTFSNFPNGAQGTQDYPGTNPGASNPGLTGASASNVLGYSFNGAPQDAVYRLQYTFPHTGSKLVVKFSGSGLQDLGDESWGLDNVEVGLQ